MSSRYYYERGVMKMKKYKIQQGLYPPTFKAAHRKPVRGGRFKVRKLWNNKWLAWSEGKNSYYNATFKTWQEAIDYAQRTAGS